MKMLSVMKSILQQDIKAVQIKSKPKEDGEDVGSSKEKEDVELWNQSAPLYSVWFREAVYW